MIEATRREILEKKIVVSAKYTSTRCSDGILLECTGGVGVGGGRGRGRGRGERGNLERRSGWFR